MAILSKLALQISTKGGESVKNELKAIDKQAQKTGKGMNAVFSPRMAAAFTAGLTAAVAEVTRAFNEWLRVMDKIQKQSIQTGLAPGLVDEMRLMEKFAGMAEGTMTRTFLYFKRQLGDGKRDPMVAELLGLTPEQMATAKENATALYREVTRVLQRMGDDDPRKNNIVNKLFGEDSGREFLKVLNLSEREFYQLERRANDLANATQQSVDQAAAFNDAMTELSEKWQNILEGVMASDDPFGLISAVRTANDLLDIMGEVVKLKENYDRDTRNIPMIDAVTPGGVSGASGFWGQLTNLWGGWGASWDWQTNQEIGNAFLASYADIFDPSTGKIKPGYEKTIPEMISAGNYLLSRNDAQRNDYIARYGSYMGEDRAAAYYDSWSDWSRTEDAVAHLGAMQAQVDEQRLSNLEQQERDQAEFDANYNSAAGRAFGMGAVPWADPTSIIGMPSRPEAGFDPVQSALDAAYDPEGERAAQQAAFEEMAKTMGEEVADALADSSLLPEASMWTDMIDDLRQGNAILQSIDDGIQVIQRKETSKIGVVK